MKTVPAAQSTKTVTFCGLCTLHCIMLPTYPNFRSPCFSVCSRPHSSLERQPPGPNKYDVRPRTSFRFTTSFVVSTSRSFQSFLILSVLFFQFVFAAFSTEGTGDRAACSLSSFESKATVNPYSRDLSRNISNIVKRYYLQ